MNNSPKAAKGLSATALILIFILVAVCFTYMIPAGEFAPGSGGEVSSDSFVWTEKRPVSLSALPELIVQSFLENATVIFTFFFVGGSVGIMVQTGAMQKLVSWLLKKAKGRHFLMIAGFTGIFTFLSLNIAARYLVSFVPFIIAFFVTLGYDAITGLAVVLLGSAMSYCTSPTGLMTLTAQSYVNLPPLSGAGFRWVCLLVLWALTVGYIYIYAEKVRKKKIEGYPPQEELPKPDDSGAGSSWRDWAIIGIYLVTIGFCVYYGSQGALSAVRMSAVFMVSAVTIALVDKTSPNHVVDLYIQSAGRFFAPAMIVGFAGTIALVWERGGIADTIVYGLTLSLQRIPDAVKAPAMFIIQSLINCAIVPGAGQAAVTMPLFGPAAELAGIPLQSAVLSFNFGDGIGDFILPYSSVLVSYLAVSGVSYRAWWQFIRKLFVIWIAAAFFLMYVSAIVWK